jgi:hypothetical protein
MVFHIGGSHWTSGSRRHHFGARSERMAVSMIGIQVVVCIKVG